MSSRWMLGAALLLGACNTPPSNYEIDAMMTQTMAAYEQRLAEGDDIEAHQLALAVHEVNPDYPGVEHALAELDELESLFNHPIRGSNVAIRKPISPSVLARILWYLPDRIFDIFDIVSFDVHIGFGIWVDAHATRAVQLALGGRMVGGIGWHDHRSLGVQYQAQAGFSVLAAGAEAYHAYMAGSSGVRGGGWGEAGLHGPGDPLYQEYRDYWAVGGGATALIVGADVDVHLLQIFDFLVGWLTFDPLNDDFAGTTGINLSDNERRFITQLSKVAARENVRQGYLSYKLGESMAEDRDAAPGVTDEAAVEAEPSVPSETPEEPAVDTGADDPAAPDDDSGESDDPADDTGGKGDDDSDRSRRCATS